MSAMCPETNSYVLYMVCQECESKTCRTISKPVKRAIAYCDGSYNNEIGVYGYGIVIILEDGTNIRLSGCGMDMELSGMRNIAGEMMGAETLVRYAEEHDITDLIIRYDYEGVEKWATEVWSANKPGTIRYQDYMKKMLKKIRISFEKIAAHTGNAGNEIADRLAKQAVGLS